MLNLGVDDFTKKMSGVAVLLHNKARSIQSETLSCAKAYLKGASAFMLIAFSQAKSKSLCMGIKLIIRAGYDFLARELIDSIPMKCFKSALQLWSRVNSCVLEKLLSLVELDELMTAVFGAFVDQAKLIMKLTPADSDDLKRCIAGAMELIQAIPRTRITFIKLVLEVGYFFVEGGFVAEALHYFKISASTIDTTPHTLTNTGGSMMDDLVLAEKTLHVLRLRTSLSMAYAHMEQK